MNDDSNRAYELIDDMAKRVGTPEVGLFFYAAGFEAALLLMMHHPELARWMYERLPDCQSDVLITRINQAVRDNPVAISVVS